MTRKHQTEAESVLVLRQIQRIRDSVPLPDTIGGLYDPDTNRLLSQYIEHGPATKALQRYHKRTGEAVGSKELSPGLRQAIKLPLVWGQIVTRYPWKVMWIRVDKQGRKRRGQKLCTSLGAAIKFQQKVSSVVPNATVVSRSRGYDIPPSLRGKLPPRWYWCPRCMKPRKYVRDDQGQRFTVNKKVWDKAKQKYKWVERNVYLLRCPMCSTTNRDPIFRRSNQPWEVRKFKKGVTRARKRKSKR
jgi:hypothetical protein